MKLTTKDITRLGNDVLDYVYDSMGEGIIIDLYFFQIQIYLA
jgi:hypothetical protein